MKRHLPLLLGLALLAGCASSSLPPAGNGFAPEEDEKRLWLIAEKEEKSLDSSGLIYRNVALEGYLDSVVRKLATPEMLTALPIRISVIRNPYLNAFTFPNGRIYIHEGMLVQMENEAQLATIIAHEMSHATGRHVVRELRNTKSKTAFFATLSSLTGNVLLPIGQLAALSAIQGYSRDMETEADTEGLRRLVAAGYDPAEAPKIFTIMQKEALDEKIPEPFFFGSHPRLQERLDNYVTLLQTDYYGKAGGTTNTAVYLRMISPLFLDTAGLNLKRGRFEAARQAIEKFLTVRGDDAGAYYLLGETWRQSGGKEGASKAREFYLKAAALDPAYPDPHRAVGLIAYKMKEWEIARTSFERYLSLAPKAADRGYIEEMIKNLR